MYKYIFKRLIVLIPVIIGVTFLVFFIMSFSPGDPATMILGNGASPETIAELRQEMGLDDPVIVQYARYMWNLIKGDMGTSYKTENSVASEIASRFPHTFKLTLIGIILAVVVSIPIGVVSATKQYSIIDGLSMVFALIGISMPSFWLGLILILVFSVNLGWFPSGGAGELASFVLPAITVGVASMATITRTTRSTMLEVIRQDYIRTAKAKGVAKKVVTRKHALRNALIPTVTVVGLQIGILLGGAVITETVFSWPGVGRLMVNSIKAKDTPTVLGCILVFAVCFSIVNLLVDILYAYIDPRIKSQYK